MVKELELSFSGKEITPLNSNDNSGKNNLDIITASTVVSFTGE